MSEQKKEKQPIYRNKEDLITIKDDSFKELGNSFNAIIKICQFDFADKLKSLDMPNNLKDALKGASIEYKNIDNIKSYIHTNYTNLTETLPVFNPENRITILHKFVSTCHVTNLSFSVQDNTKFKHFCDIQLLMKLFVLRFVVDELAVGHLQSSIELLDKIIENYFDNLTKVVSKAEAYDHLREFLSERLKQTTENLEFRRLNRLFSEPPRVNTHGILPAFSRVQAALALNLLFPDVLYTFL